MAAKSGFDPYSRELAEKIAMDLFTTGFGTRADRLVLMLETKADKRELGGWCFQAVVDRIEKHLKGASK